MKTLHKNILAGLLVGLVTVVLGTVVFLWTSGFWDTWKDKKKELEKAYGSAIAEMMGVPLEKLGPVTSCLADATISAAEANNCELAWKVPVDVLVTSCMRLHPAMGLELSLGMLTCISKDQGDSTSGQEAPMGGVPEEEDF
jgi:hypothetical protein